MYSERNISGGPEWLHVLEVRDVLHLVAGFPPIGALGCLETLCTHTHT